MALVFAREKEELAGSRMGRGEDNRWAGRGLEGGKRRVHGWGLRSLPELCETEGRHLEAKRHCMAGSERGHNSCAVENWMDSSCWS